MSEIGVEQTQKANTRTRLEQNGKSMYTNQKKKLMARGRGVVRLVKIGAEHMATLKPQLLLGLFKT